jgi:hypothetical protein
MQACLRQLLGGPSSALLQLLYRKALMLSLEALCYARGSVGTRSRQKMLKCNGDVCLLGFACARRSARRAPT